MKYFIIITSIVFLFASCDIQPMENETNPFIGTWETENGVTWVFTETTLVRNTPEGNPWIAGT